MKKAVSLVLAIALLLSLSACGYCYDNDIGSFKIMYGSYFPLPSRYTRDGAAVAKYTWDGSESGMTIIIPDTYENQKIKCIGGYWGQGAPAPFFIDVTSCLNIQHASNYDYDMVEEHRDEQSELAYYDFDLDIGKNINSIYSEPFVSVYTANGVKTACCARVRVFCNEENKTFYSEEGKLYYRADGKLVDCFIYA